MAKWKINVDLDAAREAAEHLESILIEADNEDEALTKADKIDKKIESGEIEIAPIAGLHLYAIRYLLTYLAGVQPFERAEASRTIVSWGS